MISRPRTTRRDVAVGEKLPIPVDIRRYRRVGFQGGQTAATCRRWSSAGYSVSERVTAHALRFLRHRTKRQASLLVIRTKRGQRVQVEGRAKIHMLYDCRIVGLRRRTNSNLPADLQ